MHYRYRGLKIFIPLRSVSKIFSDEDNEIESAWAVEVERRVAEIESGAVVGMPFEEVIAQARTALK